MNKVLILLMTVTLTATVSAQNLGTLHDLVIKFYCHQRAGLKTGSSGNCNGQDAYNNDNYNGKPLDGGWYDAGDYIKFGMPLGYTVYCLLKGYDLFPSAYTKTGGIPNVLTEVKYATDYLQKAVIDENTIILDVGKAQDEHQVWGVYSGNRTIYTCSGADIPAVYAACLALMSTLYRPIDSGYADKCLEKAITAFKFAKKKVDAGGDNNLYCSAQQKDGKYLYYYYKPDGGDLQRQINDKLVAAGVELYRATNDGDPAYKAWAKKSIVEMYNCMSYSFLGPLAAVEVWRQGLGAAASVSENVGFVEKMVQTDGVFKGVYKNSGWGTARDVGTAAFVYALGYIATGTATLRETYLKRAKDHVAWVTGTNSRNQSFVVGFNSGPSNIHYRPKASGPAGGLVSGPNGDGNWSNDGSAEFCEVALDYNAGITGAIAFLKALENEGDAVKVSTAFSAEPSGDIDFTSKSVTFKAGFSKTVNWTIKISGGFGSKTLSGNGTSVSAVWDGSADNGLFLSGENAAAQISIDGSIIAYDILKARALSLYIAKSKKPEPIATDIKVDDFEDSDSSNLVSGTWTPFGTQTTFSAKTNIRFSDVEGTKGLQITGTVSTGEHTSYAGAKTTFNATGTAVPVGQIKSVVFDMKASKEALVSIELEQPSISDSAYYAKTVPLTTSMNTYRLPITDFRQPDWKGAEKPLDLNAIAALRFTVYDSTGRIDLYLDNVFVDGLEVGTTVISPARPVPASFRPVIANGTLRYTMPLFDIGPLRCTVYDIAGKVVMRRSIAAHAGERMNLSLSHLPPGTYTISHSLDGSPAGAGVRFTKVR